MFAIMFDKNLFFLLKLSCILFMQFFNNPATSQFVTPIAVSSFFSEIGDDLTKVTWAHGVNNRAKLNASLNDNSMMIEADVLMGQLEGSPTGENPLPIMGHPPATTSDLSLEEFLTTILKSEKRKGVKLDFKSKDVFSGSENILEEILVKPEANFPVWLNADILPGPVASPNVPVDADYFVSTVVKKFPTAMLSVGWTTRLDSEHPSGKYTEDDVNNMTEVLSRNTVTQPVTFPVRAALAANSKEVLTGLVRSSVTGTTLTIWNSNDADKVDLAALKYLILDLGRDKVYLDLPPGMIQDLNMDGSDSSSLRLSANYGILCIVVILGVLSL